MHLFKLTANTHAKINIFGIALMLTALPLSMFLMSIAQFVLAINLVWEGNFKHKLITFIKSKPALIFSSLFLLHLLGLIYTSDFNEALANLRIKLPILIFPFILVNIKPLKKEIFKALLSIFIAAVVISTLCSLAVLLGIVHKEIKDIRDISIFISHIRLSLLVCLSILIIAYRIYQNEYKNKLWLPIYLVLVAWLIYFLTILESVTGISILIIASVTLLFIAIFRVKKTLAKVLYFVGLLSILFGFSFYLHHEIKTFYAERNSAKKILKKKSPQGHAYIHDTTNNQIENANYVWLNIEYDEMKHVWNKRSKIPFDSLDHKKQELKYTLIRFLTSKGYDKDSLGVSLLKPAEILSIENGICNYRHQQTYNIRVRLHKILWEYESYRETHNPSGHSVTLRLEFWKTSIYLIKQNPIFGVGTGDIDDAFKQAYKQMKSPLGEKYRLKSHNEYLRITVLFGIFGLIWFITVLLYPIFSLRKFNYYYLAFFIIVTVSMLTEDTIETQAGVSLYAFFSAFLYFLGNNEHLASES